MLADVVVLVMTPRTLVMSSLHLVLMSFTLQGEVLPSIFQHCLSRLLGRIFILLSVMMALYIVLILIIIILVGHHGSVPGIVNSVILA